MTTVAVPGPKSKIEATSWSGQFAAVVMFLLAGGSMGGG
jgi:hypothetical protein